ncbi:MAG: hypothetical protein WC812_03280 [Candidatus Pacearchaeota archaeon]|jgi:hypothetical protein
MTYREYILGSKEKNLEETYEEFYDTYWKNRHAHYHLYNDALLEVYDIKDVSVLVNQGVNTLNLVNLKMIGLENLIDEVEKDIIKNKFKLKRVTK